MTPAHPTAGRRVLALAVAACLAVGGTGAGLAQPLPTGSDGPATLIADSIRFERGANTVTASGGVEIFYGTIRLRAQRVVYDGAADIVRIDGPMTLIESDGRSVLIADFAQLDADLQNGVLHGARLVLDRQLQIAATEIERSEGRYTQAYQVAASSCEICADNPTPLWEIRARRVIHDQQEQQLYFERATFRALGIPIAYIPRLRVPDPTLARSTGFLAPSLRFNDDVGTQLRVPYFITLGDHADVTVTPWVGAGGDSATVELGFRQAFRNGDIAFAGALTNDTLTEEEFRGFLMGSGQFELGRDFTLDFAIEGVSDRGYLTAYGFPDQDLLESFVRISRADRNTYIEAAATRFTSLQEGDDNETLPTRTLNAQVIHRFTPRWIGGIATARLDGGGYYRLSDVDGIDGRDVARLTGALEWRRDTILPGGLLVAFEAAFFADIYNTSQGGSFTGTARRATPFIAGELRYPVSRTTPGGVTHMIEPVVQLVWSEPWGDPVPVEDSTIVEFDEANLFALDRFPGQDQREQGRRANLGVTYSRIDPGGWTLGVTAGLVLRQTDAGQFTVGSGLSGTQSDMMLATHFSVADRWQIINRALVTDSFDLTSNELVLGWQGERHAVATTFTWMRADLEEGRPLDVGEWAVDARYDITRNWGASIDWRYDFVEEAPTRAGIGISFENECVDMEFSLSRRYTTSDTLTPATEVGLTISLNGFGAGRNGRDQGRTCLR